MAYLTYRLQARECPDEQIGEGELREYREVQSNVCPLYGYKYYWKGGKKYIKRKSSSSERV